MKIKGIIEKVTTKVNKEGDVICKIFTSFNLTRQLADNGGDLSIVGELVSLQDHFVLISMQSEQMSLDEKG